ncbi:adenylate/guanylate cyclase domain-containing protein [Paenibacillus koleovorans]|uniref:adenylate/guanylate cyclase domain-containing protein n=1 Tax=Paenibacillus koleovorans TaxID=121608 RepID=UPI000FD9945A|nr:adenylate/guanylate cyclase domain-containing protein [Paenibacillus koleovorans]
MRKSVTILVLLALLLAAAGTYLFAQRTTLARSPFSSTVPLEALSMAVADGQGDLYITADARTTIYKTTTEGKMIYALDSQEGTNGGLYIFNDMSIDEQRRIYAVRTLLGAYGIKAISEDLVRYTPDGKFDRVLFTQKYDAASELRRYRVGSIKAPQVRGTELIFYNEEMHKFTQYSVDLNTDSEPKPVFSHNLPAGKYIASIDGYEQGRLYYTTRSGEIFAVTAGSGSRQVYPAAIDTANHRNFPESMQMDDMGRVVFVNFNTLMIGRVDPSKGTAVEVLATPNSTAGSGAELAFVSTSVSMLPGGEMLIIDDDQLIHRSADGSLKLMLTELTRSGSDKRAAWFVWFVALLSVLVLLYAFKLLYWNIMKRRASIVVKQVLIFTPVIALSMILIASTVSSNFTAKMQEETEAELALLARNGQNLINGDALKNINSTTDYGGPVYMEFRKRLDRLFDTSLEGEHSEGLFKAVYKVEDGRIYRIMEDDDNIHMFIPFESTPQNERVIKEGAIETERWSDNGGEWVYAIGPIYDSTGKVVGIFEADKNMEGINAHKRTVQRQIFKDVAWITAGMLLIFLLMTYFVTASIRKLRKSVASIAEGNWDTEVNIRSRDEVSDLGDSVNRMAAHIRAYIKNITDSNEAYYRFVPQQFMRFLKRENMLDVQLGDQVEQDMTVVICNIRGFYRLSNGLTPEENFNFVNSFLKRFGPSVRDNGGMINKYLGAGFMALFPTSADDALVASLRMRIELEVYNAHRANSKYPAIDIGFGLHKGPLRLGIIGEEKRLEGNVISEGVNLAIELEKMTNLLGACILVTEDVMKALASKEAYAARKLGAIRMENTAEPLQLYDVYEGDPDMIAMLKHRTKALFEQGVTYYQVGRFYDAREAFLMVLKQNRQDKAAQLYFYACDEYFQNGTGADWNGALSVS